MSAYSEIATEFKDGELLLKALEALGYKPVNAIGNPKPLVGYQGDYRTADGNGHTKDEALAMKADIIIPRKQVGGMSNDIGFRRDAQGTFHAIISDYDSSRHNSHWVKNLKYNYAEQNVFRSVIKSGGKIIQSKKKNSAGKYEYKALYQ